MPFKKIFSFLYSKKIVLENKTFYCFFIFNKDLNKIILYYSKKNNGKTVINVPGSVLSYLDSDNNKFNISEFFKKHTGKELILKSDLYNHLHNLNSYSEKILSILPLSDSPVVPRDLSLFKTEAGKAPTYSDKALWSSHYFFSKDYWFVDSQQNFVGSDNMVCDFFKAKFSEHKDFEVKDIDRLVFDLEKDCSRYNTKRFIALMKFFLKRSFFKKDRMEKIITNIKITHQNARSGI